MHNKEKDYFKGNIVTKSIRDGLVRIIPIIMTGAFSLMLTSLPIPKYSTFIGELLDGGVLHFFESIYNATFGLLSVYMTISIAYSFALNSKLSTIHRWFVTITALLCFGVLTGFLNTGFTIALLSGFGVKGMFTAIFSALISANLYILFSKRFFSSKKSYSDGADESLNNSIRSLPIILAVLLVFVTLNTIIVTVFKVHSAYELLSNIITSLFSRMGRNIFSGLLYVIISSLLWFCGIHGGDALESAMEQVFTVSLGINQSAIAAGGTATEILSKQFFDMFVLIGGCGSTLCLLIAMLIFSRRRSNRSLAKMTALPMLFNINEMMVFGLPIIFNPTMLIPFILTPIASYFIAYAATALGIVPIIAAEVNWTTPVILGGYYATGSVTGSILQVINLGVGIMIYMPFVKLLDRQKEEAALESMSKLTQLFKDNEQSNIPIILTELDSETGSLARSLVYDLSHDIEHDKLMMYYQPQHTSDGSCIGAEALLRWKHPIYGMMYPPLVIEIANEAGLLSSLEKYVFRHAVADATQINKEHDAPLKISINITAAALSDPDMLSFLTALSSNDIVGRGLIFIEVTEHDMFSSDEATEAFNSLKSLGYKFAIDDFSMGHTSLMYLQANSFDMLKLDGALVKGIKDNSRTRDIVSSIIQLSSSLNFRVCAEYVETQAQQALLSEIGCTIFQGYLYSPAITCIDFINYNKR